MSTLAMPLSLGEGPGKINDLEALVRKVVQDRTRNWGARLVETEKEDLVSFLIGEAWTVYSRYDRKKDKKPNLAAHVAHILSFRVADWYRQRFVDTRHREKPIVLSLDAPAKLEGIGHVPEAEGASADRLVDTLAAVSGDPAADRDPDLFGLLTGGDRGGAGDVSPVRQSSARAAARGAGSAAPRRVKPRIPGTYQPARKPPICSECYPKFLSAFMKVNAKASAEQRLTLEQVQAKARKRAQAVRFGKGEKEGHRVWACPRCTKIETPEGRQLMLQEAYPNVAARRAAVNASRKKGRTAPSAKRAKHGGKGSRTSRARKTKATTT